MENKQVEYSEIFERSDYDNIEEAKYKIEAVKEFYRDNPDWEVGEPEIVKQANDKYMVRIPLTKYAKEEKGRLR